MNSVQPTLSARHRSGTDLLYAVAAPGVEPYVAQELRQLGLVKSEVKPTPAKKRRARTTDERRDRRAGAEQHGGVEFSGDRLAIYRANLHLATANRLLVRLGDFPAVGFVDLRRRAARLEWERYLTPGQPVALRVTCHKSRLYHSDAVAERVAAAIGDRLGKMPEMAKFDEDHEGQQPQLVLVRLLHDHCTISLDSSGELLHRRGYRLATAKAPLRETLAAVMLLASGWSDFNSDGPAPLLDPFCGAGTIPIEAALLAFKIAPGRYRRFAFMNWPDFDAVQWDQLLAEADEESGKQRTLIAGRLTILASDRDEGAIEMARANAERAGVADAIEFSSRALSAIAPPPVPGWVVTNPPYGVRVDANRDLRNLYAQIGNVLRVKCPGWQVAMLCSDRHLLRQTGLTLNMEISLVNGGIATTLARGEVAA